MRTVLLVIAFLSFSTLSFSQTQMKSYTVGHPFTISLPDYLNKTTGINPNSSIQYKSEVKGIYGFVIEDLKEDLKMAEINYANATEFYEDFIKEFSEGEEQVKKSNPIVQNKGTATFLEADFSYFDKEAKEEIYYLVGIVETKTSFYKVLTYCALGDKAKYKEDFKK